MIETEQKVPAFSEGSRPPCPLGANGGGTCQTAFRRAYGSHGFPDSYSRAVLVLLTAMPDPSRLIPRIVQPLLKRGPVAPPEKRCIGCSLNERAAGEIRAMYRDRVHRDVTVELLSQHANDARPIYGGVEELDEADAIVADIVAAGVLLDDEIDGFGAMSRQELDQ